MNKVIIYFLMIIFVGCSQYTYKPSLKYNPKANLMANAELILTQQQSAISLTKC